MEELARQIHGVYQEEASRQGDVRHPEDYEDLEERFREYDRALARWIIDEFVRRDEMIELLRARMTPEDPFFKGFKERGGKVLWSSDDGQNQMLQELIDVVEVLHKQKE
jgi:hypothetical protein